MYIPRRYLRAMPWDKQFDRDAVLDRAMKTFWRQGYAATSMQDLVEAMGINRGSMYATFGDKRSLFLASLRMFDASARLEVLARLREGRRPTQAIKALFESFVEYATGDGLNRGCLITNTALELAAHDPEVARIVAEAQTEIERFVEGRILAGQATGEIALVLDPKATARGMLASLVGLMVLVRSRPEKALLDGVIAEAMGRLK